MTPSQNDTAPRYRILQPGSGRAVARGDTVVVDALGAVDGDPPKKFWSTRDEGQQPFQYIAGAGQVITGWDAGVLGTPDSRDRLHIEIRL